MDSNNYEATACNVGKYSNDIQKVIELNNIFIGQKRKEPKSFLELLQNIIEDKIQELGVDWYYDLVVNNQIGNTLVELVYEGNKKGLLSDNYLRMFENYDCFYENLIFEFKRILENHMNRLDDIKDIFEKSIIVAIENHLDNEAWIDRVKNQPVSHQVNKYLTKLPLIAEIKGEEIRYILQSEALMSQFEAIFIANFVRLVNKNIGL